MIILRSSDRGENILIFTNALRKFKYCQVQNSISCLRSVRLVSAGPLTLLKRGYYIFIEVEVKAFILYHQKPIVNIPIQSLIIWP